MHNTFFDPFEIIRFRTLRGQLVEIESPRCHIDSDDFRDKMERLCYAITDEFAARRSAELKRKKAAKAGRANITPQPKVRIKNANVSPLHWLKPVCYQIILSFEADFSFKHLAKRSESEGRYAKSPHAEPDIFSAGVMAIFAHIKNKRDLAYLSETQRQRLARQMWFAFRHFIPAQLINGFNEQYPLHDPKRRCKDNALVPELADWMVDQAALEMIRDIDFSRTRGPYPSDFRGRLICAQDYLDHFHHTQTPPPSPHLYEDDDETWGPALGNRQSSTRQDDDEDWE